VEQIIPSYAKECRAATAALILLHGRKYAPDIQRGVRFCSLVWDFKAAPTRQFRAFCLKQYCRPGPTKRALLLRLDVFFNILFGSFGVISKSSRHGLDVADQPFTASDELLGAFHAGTHVQEDLRTFQLAALVQLNFGTDDTTPPRTRETWAVRRVSKIGREVIPAELLAEMSQASAQVDHFITSFNIHLDKIQYVDPRIRFPRNTIQVSHWGLRDYMKSLDGQPLAIPRQHAIRDLLRRVVDSEIPIQIIDNPDAIWQQRANRVRIKGRPQKAKMTGALRWRQFQKVFEIARKIDPFTRYGNIIDTKFKQEREVSEERVVGILKDILAAPEAVGVAHYVQERLGRPLEAQDVYFRNFHETIQKPALNFDLSKRYLNAAALTKAIPKILQRLGFPKEQALWIGSKIRVDNARSAGHASPPYTPTDLQLLRVRVNPRGVTEQDFGTFMHELGHCVEGVFTAYDMDYKSLWGVPNVSFTEGFAFTFQDRTDFILGRKIVEDPNVTVLLRYWESFEIAGPALTEIRFFHWLYEHPGCKAEQMQHAIRRIGDEIWGTYYARIFGPEGYGLMSVYSHILWCSFYLADYPIGYVIAYQIRKFLQNRELACEMPRMCSLGCIYPDAWMNAAVGAPISVQPLLTDTQSALAALKTAGLPRFMANTPVQFCNS